MISAVIAAGGKGKRMGAGINKVFMSFCGREIIAHTLGIFQDCRVIDEIIVVTGTEDIDRCRAIVERDRLTKVRSVIEGGKERQDSVYAGICEASGDIVAIHDAARCLITSDEIERVVADAKEYGAAAMGVTVKDTLKSVDDNLMITGTVDRDYTVQIQTPQVFDRKMLKELHERLRKDGDMVTDDCAVFEKYGQSVRVTIGSYENIKITTPADITAAEQIIKMRSGDIETER